MFATRCCILGHPSKHAWSIAVRLTPEYKRMRCQTLRKTSVPSGWSKRLSCASPVCSSSRRHSLWLRAPLKDKCTLQGWAIMSMPMPTCYDSAVAAAAAQRMHKCRKCAPPKTIEAARILCVRGFLSCNLTPLPDHRRWNSPVLSFGIRSDMSALQLGNILVREGAKAFVQ